MKYVKKTDRAELDALLVHPWLDQHKNTIIKGLHVIKRHNDLEYKYGSNAIERWIVSRKTKRLNAILIRYYDTVLI
jgi:hypothetical protein